MNSDKAREHFSAYREGTLERGMVQALERRLAADPELAREYREFVTSYDALSFLQLPAPEPDFDLHDRIAARLDRHQLEQKNAAKPGFAGWWRPVALGGLAVVAIASAIISLNSKGGTVSQAGLTSVAGVKVAAPVTLTAANGTVLLKMSSETPRSIEVRDASGAVLESRRIDRGILESPLRNALPDAALLNVMIEGESQRISVALPGSVRSESAKGEGSPVDLAVAAAGHFGVPVVLRGSIGESKLRWAFEGKDAFANLSRVLGEAGLTVEKREGGLMVVQGR